MRCIFIFFLWVNVSAQIRVRSRVNVARLLIEVNWIYNGTLIRKLLAGGHVKRRGHVKEWRFRVLSGCSCDTEHFDVTHSRRISSSPRRRRENPSLAFPCLYHAFPLTNHQLCTSSHSVSSSSPHLISVPWFHLILSTQLYWYKSETNRSRVSQLSSAQSNYAFNQRLLYQRYTW